MNIHEIHNSLLAGKKLEIPFPSAEEAEKFRVRLAQYKGNQDKLMLKTGFMEKHERPVFSFSTQGELLQAGWVTATLEYRDRPVLKQYEVKIIEEDGGES